MEPEILEICGDCARAKGWIELPWIISKWPGICDVCGADKTSSLLAPEDKLSAPEDWLTPESIAARIDQTSDPSTYATAVAELVRELEGVD